MAYSDLPFFGTFYEVLPGGTTVPLPTATFDPTVPIYAITSDIFLVDCTGGQTAITPRQISMASTNATALVQTEATALAALIERVQAAEAPSPVTMSSMAMTSLDSPLTPGAGGGDGGASPDGGSGPSNLQQDYGTNLFIIQAAVITNYLTGIGTNTLAVTYEIQSRTNLAQTDWQSEGFFQGSELTNWTPFSLPQNGRANLFIRLKSWASSDESGLPDWWEQQYFGTNGVDPYANPKGDGWNNLYKFEHGMNPNVFYTPAAPEGFTAVYNANNDSTLLNWLPSSGLVTGYTVQKTDFSGNTVNYNLSANTTTLVDNNTLNGTFGTETFSVMANYSGGNSARSTVNIYNVAFPIINVINGVQGQIDVIVSDLPKDLSAVRIYRGSLQLSIGPTNIWPDAGFGSQYPADLPDGYFDIPAGSITNGLVPIPFSQLYAFGQYQLSVQLIESNAVSSGVSYQFFAQNDLFLDGRAQLKDNLRFKLRAATDNGPFELPPTLAPTNNFVSAGFFLDGFNFWALQPFDENNQLHDLALDSNRLLTTAGTSGVFGTPVGMPDTGAYYDYYFDETASGDFVDTDIVLPYSQADLSRVVVRNGLPVAPASLLTASEAQWIMPADYHMAVGGVSSGYQNYYGLPMQSQLAVGYYNNQLDLFVQPPGTALTNNDVLYFDSVQPTFQTDSYYFARPGVDPLPEQNAGTYPGIRPTVFSADDTTPVMFVPVGGSLTVAGYAKLAVQNGNPGIYGYLGQYFDQAYTASNGVATSTNTGILSPYGNFFATQAGQAALVTMPDIETQERGTCIVHCVSLQLDKNHDGVMDGRFNGPDWTTQKNPMVFWINNDHDEPPGNGFFNYPLDRDREVGPLYPPDYSYGYITCKRGLEDFARLWVRGVPALPTDLGYTVTLSCTAVSGSPALNLYSAQTDGGIDYLTNVTVAASLVNKPKITTLTSGATYTFPPGFFDGSIKGFLFEGTNAGEAQLTLTIYQFGNPLVQASAYVDLHDIKDLYEQAHITNLQITWPQMVDSPTTSGYQLDNEVAPGLGGNTNQVIAFVHGWRIPQLEYYIFSETMYKRLYWQGFQGTFAALRWHTLSSDEFSNEMDYLTFNRSEHIALDAGAGTASYFTNLAQRYSNSVISVCSHSQGADVVGSALRQLAATDNAPIRNYVIMQGAFTAQSYDASVTNDWALQLMQSVVPTPDTYLSYFGSISNAVQGTIVNFFNPQDFALGLWYNDQLLFIPQTNGTMRYNITLKPDVVWGYQTDGTYSWLTNNFPVQLASTTPRAVTNSIELMPFVARPRSLSVGQQTGVHGPVNSEVNLLSQFGFTGAFYDHSGEFNHQIQDLQAYPYYGELLKALLTGVP